MNNNRWNNSNPRSTKWDITLHESTPAEIYASYERAEAAHKNGMEKFPIFVGADLAGNIIFERGTIDKPLTSVYAEQ